MKHLVFASLIIVGLINFFPVVGFISADVLVKLYGGETLEGDLLILMRHRALLFGILGGFIMVSAFRPRLQPAAIAMGLVSLLGFIFLVYSSGQYGEALSRVALIDVGAIIILVIGALCRSRLNDGD